MKRSIRWRHLPAAFFAVFVAAPILWWTMDRDPPFVRVGEIVPHDPSPGDMVTINWQIQIRKACHPASGNNLRRKIITSAGRPIDYEPTSAIIDTEKSQSIVRISRPLWLPSSIEPGAATYKSEACYACNPIHKLWPVCVSEPDLDFVVTAP